MAKIKSAQHHWWPRCVSANWRGRDGKTGWLKPDGTCVRIPPDELGKIGNAHHIKIASRTELTSWDTGFEQEFETADNSFPGVITWLENLEREFRSSQSLRQRFLPQRATEEQLRILTECVVSLAVRSPMNREACVRTAEELRGPIKNPERDSLIGANMRHSQRLAADAIGARAKFAVLFSSEREFIFGDGFFHNLTAVVSPPIFPKVVAPITPHIAVIVTRPLGYMVEPRLSTLVLDATEVDTCDHAVQVYARRSIFFRSNRPDINDSFSRGLHLQYRIPTIPWTTYLEAYRACRLETAH